MKSELEKAEKRADVGETKILELKEELIVVANNLKSLEVDEEADQMEKNPESREASHHSPTTIESVSTE
jgi:hypothetical protein